MPMLSRSQQPLQQELPSTIRRSDDKAQRTFAKAHDKAVETYGEGQRAHRVAYAALKHTHEKRGSRWVPKARKGPSDPQSRQRVPQATRSPRPTYGGVDVEGNTRQDLYERARRLHVKGRSRMTKHELAKAVARQQ